MFLLLLLLLRPVSTLDYYISSSGSDSNPGTLSRPYQTLGRGIQALTALCADTPCEETNLYLREGEYTVSTPLNLSNVAAAPFSWINITSYPNETARVLGTVDVLFSTPIPNDPFLQRFQPSVVGKVLVGTLENAPPQGELIYQDRPQVPARWPDDFVALSWANGDPSMELNNSKGCINPPEEPFLCVGWARTNYTWDWSWGSVGVSNATPFLDWQAGFDLHGLFTYEWSDGRSTVSSVHPNGTVEFTRETWTNDGYWGGARYFAINAPEALSQPGEYYLYTPQNSTTTSVYWVPPPSLSGQATLPMTLSFSSTPTLLTLLNVSRVSISGLEFVGSTSSTVVVANSTTVEVCHNYFSASSYASVDAHTNFPNTNTGVVVASNIITHPGWVGVWLNGGNVTTLTSSDSSVSHNLVLNFGRDGFVFNPAIGTDDVGAVQAHNLVAGGPACGLMFSGALQTLEYNIVVDSLRSTLDMGVVCTGPRDWTVAGVNIQYNALIANGFTPILSNHVSDPLRNALYLDYGNLGHAITGNVFYQPPHPDTPTPSSVPRALPTKAWAVYNHGGRDMPVRNNIIVGINGSEGNAGGLDGGDKAQLTNGSHYFTSLEGCGGWGEGGGGWRRPPCSTLLPPSLPLLDGFAWGSVEGCIENAATCGAAPFGNVFERNVVVDAGAPTSSDPRVPMGVGLNLVNEDPLWEAGGEFSALLDFQLAPGSPAYTTLGGFQRIPMELWGPEWLGEGEWREVLFQFVPWAVGQGKGVGVEVEGRILGGNTTRTLRDLIERVKRR